MSSFSMDLFAFAKYAKRALCSKKIGMVAMISVATLASASSLAAVVISSPFYNYENDGYNSMGFSVGQFFRVGANSVTVTDYDGISTTTGVGTTVNTLTGQTVTRNINLNYGPATPNFYDRYLSLPASAGLRGPWTLKFTSGAQSSQTAVTLPVTAGIVPFVNSITLSGTAAAPIFTWTPPENVIVNGYRINIYDKSLVNRDASLGPLNNGQILSVNLPFDQTSYKVKPLDLTTQYPIMYGKNYSISIVLLQTRDELSNNLTNANVQSISRVYADFTPLPNGAQIVNLPVVTVNGAYQFNVAVAAGQVYYLDPEVATGYDYAVGLGNPDFRSVVLPAGIGDGLYDIFGIDGFGVASLLAHDWAGGHVFDFGVGGVERFRVTGIETSAGLDPLNTTAFVTGLTFTGSGTFTGTQTPITATVASDVPEPGTLALFAIGALGLMCRSNRRAEQSGQM